MLFNENFTSNFSQYLKNICNQSLQVVLNLSNICCRSACLVLRHTFFTEGNCCSEYLYILRSTPKKVVCKKINFYSNGLFYMIGSTKQVKQNTTRDVTTSSVLKQLSETTRLGLTRLRVQHFEQN